VSQAFRIAGAYDVDPTLNRVTGPNGATRLEPKVMVVLVCLAGHAGHVVSKERLLQAAWPDTAVGDDVLTRAISELRRLFGDDPKQPTVIETIPKSGYRVIATVTPVATIPPPSAPPAAAILDERRAWVRSGTFRVAAIAGVLVLAGGWMAWWLGIGHRTQPAPHITPLTVLPGHELWPTFSPDGSQVAFEWDGEKGENADVYLTMVGSPEIRRLTIDPARDGAPSWSPDGRLIAYLRATAGPEGRIHLVSPLGGSDRTFSDIPVTAPLAWSPDGRYLAARRATAPTGIYLMPLDGGAARLLIASAPPRTESAPAFSPDGHRLAYVSCATSTFGCDVYVQALGPNLSAVSPPRRVTPSAVPFIGTVAWTTDGRSVVYFALSPLIAYLWRVEADGTTPPERVEAAGLGAVMPAISRTRDRLAFVRIVVDTDVYRFRPGQPSVPVLASSFLEAEARFSPDGRRLAITSMRSGDTFRIWAADADGHDPQQLTREPGVEEGSPWWSPDGRRIAFDAMSRDWHFHVWTMGVDGAAPRQLTSGPGDQNVPYWSRDGQWVYYSADRGTGRDVWRVPAGGGQPQRMTSGGSGQFACESPDGRSILYQAAASDSPLLALPLAGGAVRQIVACVKPSAFGVGPEGVYYVACDAHPDPELHVMNPESLADRVLGRLEGYEEQMFPPLGLAVSPDGASILYPRRMRDSFDLMVIENFR